MALNEENESIKTLNFVKFISNMAIDIKLIIVFTLTTLAFIYVPVINETIIRSIIGLTMMLFVPGYSLIAALFPGKKDVDNIERLALSFGLSIAVVPLIGLGLNYTPWGIRLDSILVCITIFTLVCTLVANKRRLELSREDRFDIDFRAIHSDIWLDIFNEKNRLDKALTVVLIISILLSVCAIAYIIMAPKEGEKFTELYILGPDGKADDYPTNFILGEEKPVVVGIINHEYRNVTYDLVVNLNDSSKSTTLYSESLTLSNNQTGERTLDIKPDRTGTNMDIQFLLYADGNMTQPYLELHLWVNVTK